MASGTSRKTELKLTNVARASLEELLLDYEDFLRQRGLALWARNDPRRQALVNRRCATADEVALWLRDHGLDPQDRRPQATATQPSTSSTSSTPSTKPRSQLYASAAANAALVLIAVAVALLDRQLASQAQAFETEGGFTERLYRTRRTRRGDA